MNDKLFLIAIGGTGMRCLEAFVHLCAAGLFDNKTIEILTLDTDQTNGNKGRVEQLIELYNKVKTNGSPNIGGEARANTFFSAKLNLIFRQCITSVDYAQNMIVVKTMPGLANGAASAIDKLNIPEMLGTLAGDDTCFVVLKDTQAAAELCAEIREQIEH